MRSQQCCCEVREEFFCYVVVKTFTHSHSEITSEILFGAFRDIIKRLLGRDEVGGGTVYQLCLTVKVLISQEGEFDAIY